MDPLSLIFSAVVSGAAAALKPTAEKAVKDGYEALKALIKRKWRGVALEPIERDPASEARQAVLKEDLQAQGGLADREVLEHAKALLAAVKEHDPGAAEGAGVTIEDIDAGATANIEDVAGEGAVAIRRVKANQDVNIRGVRGVRGGTSGNPTGR